MAISFPALMAITLVLLFTPAGAGASIDSALVEAGRLVSIGAYDEAITEYERYLYFNPDSSGPEICAAIADLYWRQGLFVQASRALDRALSYAVNDSIRDALRLEAAAMAIAAGNYQGALEELIRISAFTSFSTLRDRADRYRCLVYVMTMEWGELKGIVKGPAAFDVPHRSLLDSIIDNDNINHRLSPRAAKWMSTFLPGLGQLYGRDVRNGINALALSSLTGWLFAYSIMYGYYQEAILTDVTLFWRYYNGNRWKAMAAAERYNEFKDRALQKRLLTVLSGQ
jgi:tetratricopeptide (TPR) repeat protein